MSNNDDFKLPDLDENEPSYSQRETTKKKANPLLALGLLAAPVLAIAAILWIQNEKTSSGAPVTVKTTGKDSQQKNPTPVSQADKSQPAHYTWIRDNRVAEVVDPAGIVSSVSWWKSLFGGTPKKSDIIEYFEFYGYKVANIKLVQIREGNSEKNIQYLVYATNFETVYKVPVGDLSADKEINDLVSGIPIEQGLPAGKVWQVNQAVPVTAAAEKKVFLWSYTYDKTFKNVTVDRCYLDNNIVSESRLKIADKDNQRRLSVLQSSLDIITNLVKNSSDVKLSAIPADPPEPDYASAKFGGSGSGEPTKTGVRALGGAAGGAAIGGLAAGGDGAGYGAAAGFLGGLIYDVVSKANDSDKLKKQVAAENARKKAQWLQAKKALAQQREVVKQEALQYRQSLLTQYRAQLVEAQSIIPFK